LRSSPLSKAISADFLNGQGPGAHSLPPLPPGYHLDSERIDLKELSCSERTELSTIGELFDAKPPEAFSYAASLLPPLGLGLAITLGVSLAVYGVFRALGWVIGGFAAS